MKRFKCTFCDIEFDFAELFIPESELEIREIPKEYIEISEDMKDETPVILGGIVHKKCGKIINVTLYTDKVGKLKKDFNKKFICTKCKRRK